LLILSELSAVDLLFHHLENVIVSFFSMRDDTVRTILDAVPERKGSIIVKQIERTPAEKTGLPFFKIMPREFYRWSWIGLPA